MFRVEFFSSMPCLACLGIFAVSILMVCFSRTRVAGILLSLAAVFAVGFMSSRGYSTFDNVMGGFMMLLGALCLALMFGLGAITSLASAPGGRLCALLVTVFPAALMAAFGYMVGDVVASFRNDIAPWIGVAVTFCVTWAPAILTCFEGEYFRGLVRDAPAAAEFGMEHFTGLDKDNDGLLSQEHLEAALAEGEWDAREADLLKYLISQFDEIGHEIGRASTTMLTVMPVAGNMLPMMSRRTVSIRAISMDDLRGYPERCRRKWAKWM